MTSSSRLPKHSWTKEEEAGLVECLVELVNVGGWRFDNETFRPGYLNQLARMMAFKIPVVLGGMMKKCIIAEKEVFDNWVKSHPAAKGLLNKLFVHYDELSYVFGKDRSTGGRVESFADIGSNDPAGYDAFAADAAPDTDFPSMYSQGLNMSPDDLMGTRIARVSERRNVSSRSKRKRPGHAIDSGNIVRTAIEYENEQLNHIAEWPVLQRQDASQTRQEIIRQLEAIPELTLMDRCRLMCILMRNVDDMKAFLEVPDNINIGAVSSPTLSDVCASLSRTEPVLTHLVASRLHHLFHCKLPIVEVCGVIGDIALELLEFPTSLVGVQFSTTWVWFLRL
ncbi:retrotransposon protein [Cucumis melo var. makuwa]|uniref:Retrotransposon protein n=1 Tax=Cucumis melo var. makuwa TaxID=1194695 RepID=A0A5D3BC43_CUCMM|nr:retrotransposon protein [Cucumis melo var. makuwa]TYJ95858.1 retrotransposon protein [Cucumis melo var. makuwa]